MHFLNALLVAAVISPSVSVVASPKGANLDRRTYDDYKDKDAESSVVLQSTPTLPAKDRLSSIPPKDQHSYNATSTSVLDKDKPLSNSMPMSPVLFLEEDSSLLTPGFISFSIKSSIDDKPLSSTTIPFTPYEDELSAEPVTTPPNQEPNKDDKPTSSTLLPEIFTKDEISATSTSLITITGSIDDKAPTNTSVPNIPAKDKPYLAVEPSKDDKITSIETSKPLETFVPAKDKTAFVYTSDAAHNKISTKSQTSSLVAVFPSKDALASKNISAEHGKISTKLPSTTITSITLDKDKILSTLVLTVDSKATIINAPTTTASSTLGKDKAISTSTLNKDSTITANGTLLSSLVPARDQIIETPQPRSTVPLSYKHQYESSLATTKDQTISPEGSVLSATTPSKDQIISTSAPAKDQNSRYLQPLKPVHTSAKDQISKSLVPVNNQASILSQILNNIHTLSSLAPAKDIVDSTIHTTSSSSREYHNLMSTTSSTLGAVKPTSQSIGTTILVASSPALEKDSKTYLSSFKDKSYSPSKKTELDGIANLDIKIGLSSNSSTVQVSTLQSQLGPSKGVVSLSSKITPNGKPRSSIAFKTPPSPSSILGSEPKTTAIMTRTSSSAPKLEVETSTFPGKGIGSTSKAPFLNRTSLVIPVWSPSLLGNAYGGGFVTMPSVFVTIFSGSTISTTSIVAIPSKYESSKPENYPSPSHSFINVAIKLKDTSSAVPDINTPVTQTMNRAGNINNPMSTSTSIAGSDSKNQKEITAPLPTEIFQSTSKRSKGESKYPTSLSSAVIPATISSSSPGSTSIAQDKAAGFPLSSQSASNDESLIYSRPLEIPVILQSPRSSSILSVSSQIGQTNPQSADSLLKEYTFTQPSQSSSSLISSVIGQTTPTIPKSLPAEFASTQSRRSSSLSSGSSQVEQASSTSLANPPEALATIQSPQSSAHSPVLSQTQEDVPNNLATIPTYLAKDESHTPDNSPQTLITVQSPLSSAVSSAIPSGLIQNEQGKPIGSAVSTALLSTDRSQALTTSPQILTAVQPPQSSVLSSVSSLVEQEGHTSLAISGSNISEDKSGTPGNLPLSSTQLLMPSHVTQDSSASLDLTPSSSPGNESLLPTKSSQLSVIMTTNVSKESSIPVSGNTPVIGESTFLYGQSTDTTDRAIKTDKPIGATAPGSKASLPTGLYSSRNGSVGIHYSPGYGIVFQGFAFKHTIGAAFGFIAISMFFFLF